MRNHEVLLGKCQNLFWDNVPGAGPTGMTNFRYCGNPAMDLPAVRNNCAACQAHRDEFGDQLIADTVERFTPEGAAAWLLRQEALLADLYAWRDRRAAEGASVEELIKIRADLAGRQRLHDAMTARWAAEIAAAEYRELVTA